MEKGNPLIKPSMWCIDPGIVAYNCSKNGIPVPVLAMPFWEGSGKKTFDVSGNGNHGILTSGANWVRNIAGSAIFFNGTSDQIDCGNATNLNMLGAVTMEARVYRNSDATMYVMAKRDAGANYQYNMALDVGILKIWDAVVGGIDLGVTVPINTWTHVAIVINSVGTGVTGYVNGVAGTQKALTAFPGNTANVIIGNRVAGTAWFSGVIDNVRIYNRSLNHAQVKFLAENPYFMYEMPEEYWEYVVTGLTILDYERASMRGSHRGIMVGVG